MGHIPHLILDLTLILCAAACVTILFKALKQPVVLGYIIAGFLVGPNFDVLPTIAEVEGIKTWAEIGVIFLLFGLGLEFSFKKLLKIGGVALITALAGVIFTITTGYLAGKFLGWHELDSLFFGGVLAIASTSIIVRAFEELNVKNQKFAGIVLGVLVIEDLVAVVLMVVLTTVSVSRTFEGGEMIFSVLKLLFFLIIWFVGGIFFIPTVFKVLRKYLTGESLMILSIALCFAMVYFANMAGFSPALGAFIMGSILAETSKAEKISEGIHSIKNLFGAIFFVSVGMLINPELLIEYWRPVLAAVLILLIVKPLFVAAGALLTGQPLKTAVQSGMSLSQIGEFSFIIATLGLTLNVTSEFLYPVAVAVSVITTFTTPFMIRFSEPVYVLIDKKLPLKWKEKLNNYSFASRQVNEVSAWRKLVKFYLINLILFSTIILAITLLSTKFVLPSFQSGDFGKHLVAGTTLLALAPFLWALAFRKLPSGLFTAVLEKPFYRGPVIALLLSRIVLAIILIGFFFYQTYSSIAAITGVLISLILLFILRKRISDFYARIETRFISNLKAREQLEKKYSALVPWDAHITKIELESISWMAGKKLKELRLRENFGINIAVIQRGDIYINVPDRNQYLFPNDILFVIGSDEDILRFTEAIQNKHQEKESKVNHEIVLHSILLDEKNEFVNKSIRDSAIRELTKGLVVGVERDSKRFLNPESDFVLKPNDILWIAGDDLRIKILLGKLSGETNEN